MKFPIIIKKGEIQHFALIPDEVFSAIPDHMNEEYGLFWQAGKIKYERFPDKGSRIIVERAKQPPVFQIWVDARCCHAMRNAYRRLKQLLRVIPNKIADLKEKYYYGRLSYQYEKGMADGRRDVLNNLDLYKDLSPDELTALTAQPDHR